MKPKTLDDFPDLKAAQKRYQELGSMLTAAQKDHDDAVAQLNTNAASESSGGRLQLRAAELTTAGSGGVAVIDSVTATSLREKISQRHTELATLHEALRQQRQIVDQLQSEASREICEAIKPEYQAIVGNIATCLIALGDAVDAEFAFRDQLQEKGIAFTLPQVALHSMRIAGRPQNDTASIRALQEVKRNYPRCTRWEIPR